MCGISGRLGRISALRIWECDRLDAKAAAEIERGGKQRMSGDCRPEIELVASAVTVEALEEVARDVDREAGILRRTGRS